MYLTRSVQFRPFIKISSHLRFALFLLTDHYTTHQSLGLMILQMNPDDPIQWLIYNPLIDQSIDCVIYWLSMTEQRRTESAKEVGQGCVKSQQERDRRETQTCGVFHHSTSTACRQERTVRPPSVPGPTTDHWSSGS